MKLQLPLLLLIGVLPLVLGTIAGACDGDGGLTLEEYFRRIQALSDELDERFEPLVEALNEGGASEAEAIDAIRDFYIADVPILRGFVDAVDGIDPPVDAEDTHNEFLDAGTGLLERLSNVADRLAGVESTAEIEEILDDPDLETASDRFDNACFALQDIADANGIVFDLGCEDEE